MPSQTISIRFLLVSRSIWVVTWPIYDNLEFWAKFCQKGQKWPKKAPNDRKWSECLKNDILNHLHRISARLAIVLSGHMTSLWQFWLWGQNWPKMAEKGPEWPNMVWISKKWHPKPSPLDFCFSCDHFEWSHDQFTTSLSLGPKLAEKWPKMAEKGPKWPKMTWTYGKWLLKPSPLKFCPSRGRFEWSHD